MSSILDLFGAASKDRHLGMFMVSLAVAIFCISYFVIASALRDEAKTDNIIANQAVLNTKLENLQPQNITVINAPANSTFVLPDNNNHTIGGDRYEGLIAP